jgi:hypothetical protein
MSRHFVIAIATALASELERAYSLLEDVPSRDAKSD